MSNVNSTRKPIVTAKDIALDLATGGAAKVREKFVNEGFTVKTLDGAIALFGGVETDLGATLSALRGELFTTVSNGRRGRPAVAVGATREYSVQEVGETGAFVRLPVGVLGLIKGDTVTVTFDDGVITVTRS
jgi:hypothetical protein